MIRVASIALALTIGVISAAEACSPADIEIKNWSWSVVRRYILIVGEIANNCSSSTGAGLQAVVRDAAGNVVFADEWWPASVRNIAPGDTYPFHYRIENDPRAEKVGLRVFEVRQWP